MSPDSDGDSIDDPQDNCPNVANAGQADADSDGFGDACDSCPSLATATLADYDDDGIGDACDTSTAVSYTDPTSGQTFSIIFDGAETPANLDISTFSEPLIGGLFFAFQTAFEVDCSAVGSFTSATIEIGYPAGNPLEIYEDRFTMIHCPSGGGCAEITDNAASDLGNDDDGRRHASGRTHH